MSSNRYWLPRHRFSDLLARLHSQFSRVLGPRVIDGAVQFERISSVDDLPTGVRDDQQPGSYALRKTDSPRHFSWSVGPQSLKPLVFAASEPLWQVNRDEDGRLAFEAVAPGSPPTAVIGVRACDLAALELQDRHFLRRGHEDPQYAARRESLFLVAVHCGFPADTCFCASTGDGPAAKRGFDLALYELDDGFLIEAGSDAGAEIINDLAPGQAEADRLEAADGEIKRAAEHQQRRLPAGSLSNTLFGQLDHPRWGQVGERCLSCGNCTAVCPSCFCYKELDAPALNGESSEHRREWDSCFSAQHSSMAGFQVRADSSQNYRQWLTHKFDAWHEQYGRSGCVGCGRCITWCPVGIDVTEEVSALCEGVVDE